MTLSGYDRWLARYRCDFLDAWCANTECENHAEPITVDYEEEYGLGWITPEDCPLCHATLTTERPSEDE